MKKIISIFEETGALKKGHFKLTSGLHSSTYFQCALVLQYPEYCSLIAGKIADKLREDKVDVVISPAIGGIVIGQEVGRQLGVRTIFSEREQGEMKLRRGFEL
ncbi:MAG: orotate phosphoribosyltransferase, partial [Candidatus Heimdallarchaeota archaeon]|nr:orotate phosphoribosyltransferase [Candidatus Heimdallarchaeota archaeon]